ncbi:FAD-binding oxidoreductase [Nocardia goodfellowii]
MPSPDGALPGASGFSRRSLIRGASGIAAVAAAGAVSARTAAAAVGPAEWARLRGQLRGALVLRGEPDYGAVKALVDPRFDDNAPLGVVRAAETGDVQAAVTFARGHGLPLAVRAGGHSFVGASAATGALVIDVRKLDEVGFDADHVTFGAGLTGLAALKELVPSGLSLPVGTCSSVGLAGLTVGGGLGVDSRRYGMTCDRLVAAELVLPNGELVRVDPTTPDLFWALRGAGGATGIVTSLTFRPIPAIAKDVIRLTFPGDQAARRVLEGWAQWMPIADRAVYARVDVVATPDGPRCDVLIVCPAGDGGGVVRDLTTAAGMAPTKEDDRTGLEHLAAVDDVNLDKPEAGTTRIAGSDVVAGLSPMVINAIVDVIAARSRANAPGQVMVEPIDGAIREITPGASAFPWRAHAAALEWAVMTTGGFDEAYRWITSANQALSPYSAGGYLNHVEPTDTVQRCFGPNFPRLQYIRQAIDPDRVLRWGING